MNEPQVKVKINKTKITTKNNYQNIPQKKQLHSCSSGLILAITSNPKLKIKTLFQNII